MIDPLPVVAPRIVHNQKLAEKFGLGPEYPPATKQLEAIPFNRRALKPFGYNPSIVRFGDKILLAYRYHEQDWHTKLAIAELNQKFEVVRHKEISLPGSASQEDPHLFVHKNVLCMAWVESASLGRSIVKYGTLVESKEWAVTNTYQPKFGQNDGNAMEKNWVFNSVGDRIMVIYSSSPTLSTFIVNGAAAELPAEYGKPPHFPWGEPRGGTSFLPLENHRIRFWHSRLDNENNPIPNNPTRRYYIGCTLYDAEMKALRHCSRPLVFGSEASDLTDTEIKSCRHHKPNVVLVSGAITRADGSFVLSVGANDAQCCLLRVMKEGLKL